MTKALGIGFSPCPNDTFVFHALVAGDVEIPGFTVDPWVADIEELNTRALGSDPLALTKLSLNGFAHVAQRYLPLRVGAVLGRGCGPLVVARQEGTLTRLAGRRIATPGRYTTASLMLRLFAPTVEMVFMRFDKIMPAVVEGRVDAGVIIHEGRFTYASQGVVAVADLGALWEAETKLPLPLGVVAASRSAAIPMREVLEDTLRESILKARANPDASAAFVRGHAQDMDPDVCRRHIALYVNTYSLDLGQEGKAAISELLKRGASAGVLPFVAWPE